MKRGGILHADIKPDNILVSTRYCHCNCGYVVQRRRELRGEGGGRGEKGEKGEEGERIKGWGGGGRGREGRGGGRWTEALWVECLWHVVDDSKLVLKIFIQDNDITPAGSTGLQKLVSIADVEWQI